MATIQIAARTDRNNNPTAMTTDVAKTLGLQQGKDYVAGDAFDGGTTAKIIGNPYKVTIAALDTAANSGKDPFYTAKGDQRWTHTTIPTDQWKAMDPTQKFDTITAMYSKEGGSGVLTKDSQKFVNGVTQARQTGNSDTAILDNLATRSKQFSTGLAQARKIESNDSKILNYLSKKNSGKESLIPSVPDKGQSNQMPSGVDTSSIGSAVQSGLTQGGIGAAKSVGNIPNEAQKLGTNMGSGLADLFSNTAIGKSIQQNVFKPIGNALGTPEQWKGAGQDLSKPIIPGMDPTNKAQQVGFAIGQMAQLFVPGLGEEELGGKAALATSDLMKGTGMLGDVAAGVAKVGTNAAVQATKMGGIAALQTGGNKNAVLSNAALGAAGPVVGSVLGPAIDTFAPGLSNMIQKSTFKLNPNQATKLASNVNRAVETLNTDYKIVGTATGRLNKVSKLIDGKEAVFQNFLDTAAKDVKIPASKVVSDLDAMKDGIRLSGDAEAVAKARVVAEKQQALLDMADANGNISVSQLNKFKRTLNPDAWGKQGFNINSEVHAGIQDIARTSIEDATKGLTLNGKPVHEFNADYGNLLNAKKFLKMAASKGNKTGFSGALRSFVFGAIGNFIHPGPVGEAIGAVAEPAFHALTGTFTSSTAAAILSHLGQPVTDAAIQNLMKIAAGTNLQASQGQ